MSSGNGTSSITLIALLDLDEIGSEVIEIGAVTQKQMARDNKPINHVFSRNQVKRLVYGNTSFYLMTRGKPRVDLRVLPVWDGDVLKRKGTN